MPKIIPIAPEEGDIITKESLKSTPNAVEAIDNRLDAENFREEGLDWRSFEDGCTVTPKSTRRPMVYATTDKTLSRDRNWKIPNYSSSSDVINSVNNQPRLDFDWDPETDSHMIIRCSLFVNSMFNPDYKSFPVRKYDAWDFGLMICPPVEPGSAFTVPEKTSRRVGSISSESPVVWPYQRMYLNMAFTQYRERGTCTRKEWLGTGDYPSHGLETWIDADDRLREGGLTRYYNASTYNAQRGQWDQYGYDRSTAYSDGAEYLSGTSNSRIFRHAGPGRVYLVYRSHYATAEGGSGSDGVCEIDGFTLSCQIIRR